MRNFLSPIPIPCSSISHSYSLYCTLASPPPLLNPSCYPENKLCKPLLSEMPEPSLSYSVSLCVLFQNRSKVKGYVHYECDLSTVFVPSVQHTTHPDLSPLPPQFPSPCSGFCACTQLHSPNLHSMYCTLFGLPTTPVRSQLIQCTTRRTSSPSHCCQRCQSQV